MNTNPIYDQSTEFGTYMFEQVIKNNSSNHLSTDNGIDPEFNIISSEIIHNAVMEEDEDEIPRIQPPAPEINDSNYPGQNNLSSFNEEMIVDDEFNEDTPDDESESLEENPRINDENVLSEPRTNKKIFEVSETKKGRKPKGSNEVSPHNEKRADNIKIRIKGIFIENVRSFINSKIPQSYNYKNSKGQVFQKISRSEIIKKTIEDFKSFFTKSVEEVFSEKVSDKCKNYDDYHNRIVMDDIIERGEDTELIFLLKTKMGILYEVFLGILKDERFKGLKRIGEIIDELKKKEKRDSEYIKKFFENCLKAREYWEEVKNNY